MGKEFLEAIVELAKSRLLLVRFAGTVILSGLAWWITSHIPSIEAGLGAANAAFGRWVSLAYVAIGCLAYVAIEWGAEKVGSSFLNSRNSRKLKARRELHKESNLARVAQLVGREQTVLRCFIDSEQRELSGATLHDAYRAIVDPQQEGLDLYRPALDLSVKSLSDQGFIEVRRVDPAHPTRYLLDEELFDWLMERPSIVGSLTIARTIPRWRPDARFP